MFTRIHEQNRKFIGKRSLATFVRLLSVLFVNDLSVGKHALLLAILRKIDQLIVDICPDVRVTDG